MAASSEVAGGDQGLATQYNNLRTDALVVQTVGTAVIGGNVTGNTRGTQALDIQSHRESATEVASGDYATAIGHSNTASGDNSTAIGRSNTVAGTQATGLGYNNTASGTRALAVGYLNTASGESAMAIGRAAIATGTFCLAMGYGARGRIERTTNICGPQINRKDDGETAVNAFHSFCGAEVILMSKEVDLEAVADQTLILPSGCKFWLNEVGLIATVVNTLTTQPTVRYGITGDLDKHGTAAITTALTAAGKREIETPSVPEDGETTLTAGVTIVATATEMKGRFYWKGMLIEDE